MEEQLLHFIWHKQAFDRSSLITTTGEKLEIIESGTPNHDQGPDFVQSRIRINGQLWAGHVEIHVRSSAWYLHQHEHDPHYQNVILHVVWKEDVPVYHKDGMRIPCLEFESRVDVSLLRRYDMLMNNQDWVPCAESLHQIPEIVKTNWLERMMAERLEEKTRHATFLLGQCQQHWEQLFLSMLGRQLGSPANGDTMEKLCLKVPWNVLRRHGDRPEQMEAILFGVAGMLEHKWNDIYPRQLWNEFQFLRKKYALTIIPGLEWKFMRMRPVHFPTMRIAQLAAILSQLPQLTSLLEAKEPMEIWMERFCVTPLNAYWDHHYHFGAISKHSVKRLGTGTGRILIVNVVVPMMFLYGKLQGRPDLKDHALALWQSLPAEKNHITDGWKKCGWVAGDAGQSQALIHLRKMYCQQRRCMHCAVGMKVMR